MPDYLTMLEDEARRQGVDPHLARAVMSKESAGNPDAVSSAGATGLMQLMPGTAQDLGVDPRDPAQNIRGGVTYLRQQLDRYGDNPALALAAYNAGPGRVDRAGGVPNIPETQDYVRNITGRAARSSGADIFGMEEPQGSGPGSRMSGPPDSAPRSGDAPAAAGGGSGADIFGLDDADPNMPDFTPPPGGKRDLSDEIVFDAQTGRYSYAHPGGTITADEATGAPVLEIAQGEGDQERLKQLYEKQQGLRNAKVAAAEAIAENDKFDPTKPSSIIPGDLRRAASQGFSFSFGDELSGAGAAIKAGAQNLVGLNPGYTAGQAYRARVDAERDAQDKFASEHPYQNVAAQIAGGAVNPASYMGGEFIQGGRAAGIASQMGRAGLIGGAYGAINGAGAADGGLGHRAVGALGGGLAGLATGAGAAGFVGSTPAVGRAIRAPFVPLAQRQAEKAVRLAEKQDLRVGGAIERALMRDQVVPLDFAATAKARPMAPAFISAGPNMTGMAEVLAQSPGPGSTIVRNAVRNHQGRIADEVTEDIGTALGGKGDFFGTLDKRIADRRATAAQGMGEVGEHLVTLDQNSVSALRSDLSKSAIKDAANNALASPDPEVRAAGAMLNGLSDRLLDKPSGVTVRVRDAQDISKALLDGANAAFKSGDGARGTALKALGKAVRTNAAEPDRGGFAEYGAWLKEYGDQSADIEALEKGRQVFNNSMDNNSERLRLDLADASESERDHFRKGVAEALLAQARSKGGIQAMRQLARSKEFGDRLQLAFPDKASFEEFMSSAERRINEQDKANKVLNGSQTYGRIAAAKELEDQGGASGADRAGDALDLLTANIPRLGTKAAKLLLKNIPRKDRSIIGNDALNSAAARGISDPVEMERMLKRLEELRAIRIGPAPRVLPGLIGGEAGRLLGSAVGP